MKTFRRCTLIGAAMLMVSAQAPAAPVSLVEYALSIDGIVANILSGAAVPAEADVSAFDTSTGIGRISLRISGKGPHYVGLFVDHDIDVDSAGDGFDDEDASLSGSPAIGQTWEIGDPASLYPRFEAGALGDVGAPSATAGDVSMALAWSFVLTSDDTASVQFLVSAAAPGLGFYLEQLDKGSQTSVYLSSCIGTTCQIPEPPSLGLVGLGLLGLWQVRRRSAGWASRVGLQRHLQPRCPRHARGDAR